MFYGQILLNSDESFPINRTKTFARAGLFKNLISEAKTLSKILFYGTTFILIEVFFGKTTNKVFQILFLELRSFEKPIL